MYTENDLRNYAYNANLEMRQIQKIPRKDRNNKGCIYCQVDEYGNIFWSSMVIG